MGSRRNADLFRPFNYKDGIRNRNIKITPIFLTKLSEVHQGGIKNVNGKNI